MNAYNDHRIAVAPMMEWTDRNCRAFHRVLSRQALLYTEMVASAAVIHGDRDRLIGFDALEHPVACQLGGSDPAEMVEAARIVEAYGYDEVNINVGCPSDRVQSGRFGACLMKEPGLVAECVHRMKAAVSIPVTVKCRIGVDEQDPEPALDAMADAVADAGVDALWVHARKAWLQGLSPKENRDIPPLDYQRVYRLKERLPDLYIGINGGIADLDAAEKHLEHVDGVMLGRAAYHDPWILARVDSRFHGQADPASDRPAAVAAFREIAQERIAAGMRANQLMRHVLGLFHGVPGARAWRRRLTVDAVKPGAGIEVLDEALQEILDTALDKSPALGQLEMTGAVAS
ncbi:tRNA dihydrouridine(20/20a) synthase DusA [Stappia sp. MMSF_3263]|uniref:tRNA dihydrouridine(20/20a) synthase DusA n=1 Tax=Stappia sp. MMSF_3263 TaxID=3046693 RepID=UPI00273F885B|nr:tRNA dihydrouridine(20/20a) synthase DusA [Stappia sp. MMSF_3263]